MSEGKNIDIRIAATGGDQAAAEVRKVEEAGKSLANPQTSTSTGFGGMLDKLPQQAEAAAESIGDLVKETEAAGEALEDAGEKAGDLEKNVEKIKQAQMAQAFAQGAQKVSDFAGKIARAGTELDTSFGPENAAKIREVASSIESLSSGASTVAMAFAVGGPIAGAIAGTGVMLGETASAWAGMNAAQDAAAASSDRAAEMQEKLNDLLKNGIESQEGFAAAVLTDEIQETYKAETEALKGLIEQLDAAQKITKAGDQADAAQRDNADAEAIRNGAAPEDVKAKRAADDAALQKRRIDEDFVARQGIDLKKKELANELGGKLQALENDPAAIEADKDKSRKAFEAAKESSDNSRKDLATAGAVNEQEKRRIDTKSAGKIEGLGADKAERLRKEQEAATKKAADEKREAAKKAAEEKRAGREKSRTLNESISTSELGMNAGKEANRLGNRKGASQLHKKAESLMNNPSEKGNDELVAMMERFVNWAEGQTGGKGDGKASARLVDLERKLVILEKRQKNSGSQ